MNIQDVIRLESEAERLLSKIQDVRDRYNSDPYFKTYLGVTGFRETGALRRASMDMTRELSRFRNPK